MSLGYVEPRQPQVAPTPHDQNYLPDARRPLTARKNAIHFQPLSLNAMVYYFVLSWLPLILVRIGANQQDAILASSLTNLGGMAAAFITGPLMDRFGAYRVVILHFLAGAACALIVGYVLTPAIAVIVPAALCLSFCVSGLQKGVSALTMSFYPTELPSAGLGVVLGVGRSGAIVGPILAGVLMAGGWSPSDIFYMMAAPLVAGAAIVFAMWSYYERATGPALVPAAIDRPTTV